MMIDGSQLIYTLHLTYQYKTRPGPKRCTYVSTCGNTLFVCVSTSPNNACEHNELVGIV